MEQSSARPKKAAKRGIPLWLLLVLCGVIILMTLTIAFLVLLHLDVVRCVPTGVPEAEATPAIQPVQTPEPQQGTLTAAPGQDPATPEPTVTDEPSSEPTAEPTAEPTEAPTAEPTAAPTEAPTPKPTAAPTPVPDSFTFGGKKVKTGAKTVNGKKLGINGKKNKLRHITADEVNDLIALCPDLEELELEYCYMDDYAPLKNLVKLRNLKLIYCGAGKGNAIAKIDWVKELKELRTLNLSHNSIDDTAALSGLTKLTYLNISGNPLEDEDLKPISNLTNLETLYVYDLKKITDVSPLAKLSKLTFLHVGHNSKLKTVKSLTSLKKLKYLRVNSTKVSDLSYFDKFAALNKLDINKCPIDTKTVSALKNCKKLEKVVIDMSNYDLYNAILDLFTDGFQLKFLYSWSE